MHFSRLLAFVPLLASVMAVPATTTVAPPAPSFTPTGREYYLKTQLVSGNKDKDGLYVEAYHTGAGFNDAVLVKNKTTAAVGFLNGTRQEFDLHSTFPWGFVLDSAINYAYWESVQINAGYGQEGFYFNNTDHTGRVGLKYVPGYPYETAASPYNEFIGWLACDWYHDLPQLFWLVNETTPYTLPSTCSQVELIREYV